VRAEKAATAKREKGFIRYMLDWEWKRLKHVSSLERVSRISGGENLVSVTTPIGQR
jgi:hypothetical protein